MILLFFISINDHSDYEAVIIWDAINKFVFGLSMSMFFVFYLDQNDPSKGPILC